MPPKLTIIILTCNQKDYTLRLLRSMGEWLTAHSEGADKVEVLLVDNGSTDGSVEAVREWMYKSGVVNLRIIEARENLGVACGRNLGLREAKGKVLMLLDNDTIADTDTFEALRDYVLANSSCGIVAPALYAPDGELQASAKPYPGLWLKLRHVLRPGKELAYEREELEKLHPFYVIGACQVFRREIIEKVGLLDEKIFYGPEDCDFCMRVRNAGYSVDYLRHLRLTHDWRRLTRRSPFGKLGRRHAAALLHFWMKQKFKGSSVDGATH